MISVEVIAPRGGTGVPLTRAYHVLAFTDGNSL